MTRRSLRGWLTLGFVPTILLALGSEPGPTAGQAVPATTQANSRPTLKVGDTGAAVEDLQRRLNARLAPAPGLDVDGDFGPATREALLRFQRAQGLRPTGMADPATWSALGPPPPPEPEAPPPEVVNREQPPRQPADPLDGPPFVTARAWAIADGSSGTLLHGLHAATPLPMASTTKIMTALIVVRLAAKEPSLLDEIVTFSERADQTPGSTSALRAGERVPVRELLYGLLLPSGNDAATAFAEHLGARLKPPADRPQESDPVARFVAEMNRQARELGLEETRFANPHGLPAEHHQASARDLARLAALALKEPVFARVVGTARHGCTVEDGQGRSRNLVWRNTNRLLAIEGYDGVKTGTTTAAGNCLVASGHRDGAHRIVVVLGAGTSDGRYVDARNLFRWAWHARQADAVMGPESRQDSPQAPPVPRGPDQPGR